MSLCPARAVVFDLDGTLIDSKRDIAAATNHALKRHGRPELPEDTIAGFVGDGARLLIARAAGLAADAPELAPLLSDFLEYYTEHPADRTTLMPGAERTLSALSALPLALCTNKPRVTTDRVLHALLPGHPFWIVVAGGDGLPAKPDPACLQWTARRLDVPPEALVVIGDGPQDIQCARAAGARSIAVTAGFAPRDVLEAEGPTAIATSLLDVVPLVRSWASPQATSA